MKKTIKRIAVVMIINMLIIMLTACSSTKKPTASPSSTLKPTSSPIATKAPTDTESPSADASTMPSETADASLSPSATMPLETDKGGDIEDYVEGKVIDEKDVPENILTSVRNLFPNMEIQSITFATYQGKQAYKLTLQGEGELAKTCYVYSDSTVVVPAMGD